MIGGWLQKGSGKSGDGQGVRPGVHAALDVGSAKIACFIGRAEQTAAGPRPRVIGVGHQSSRGVRAGAVVDLEAARDAIREAVQRAERMAGLAVNAVTVTMAAGQLRASRTTAQAGLHSREVTERDMRRVLDAARAEFAEPDRMLLHVIPVRWAVDGQRGLRTPLGMPGRRLGAEVALVSAAVAPLRNLLACIEGCHLDLKGVAAAPYASGLSALAEDEMELGALLLDMGAGATTAAMFADGVLQHAESAPVGGGHVTSDIARGLSTPLAAAERLKILYGSALDSPDDDREMIEVPPVAGDPGAGMGSAPRAMLNAIIRPRLEETFELIRDRLADAGFDSAQTPRLVLTGGAAQLPGAMELAARVFGKPARLARPQGVSGLGDAVSGPGFAAAAGVLLAEARGPAQSGLGRPQAAAAGNRAGRSQAAGGRTSIWRWLAESF